VNPALYHLKDHLFFHKQHNKQTNTLLITIYIPMNAILPAGTIIQAPPHVPPPQYNNIHDYHIRRSTDGSSTMVWRPVITKDYMAISCFRIPSIYDYRTSQDS
jgi:hypothetical protein